MRRKEFFDSVMIVFVLVAVVGSFAKCDRKPTHPDLLNDARSESALEARGR